ncbi:MAG: hypothetical protein RLZZ546_1615, partial [Bacteroidota bacterium]
PFSKFSCGDTFAWFAQRGVELKIEEDGRAFPITDSSQSIIDCFISLCRSHKIKILTNKKVKNILIDVNKYFVHTDEETFKSNYVVVACGSSPFFWDVLKKLNHAIVDPVPSLFTFNVKDSRLMGLMGITIPSAEVKILDTKLVELGPVLITHWGLSGPAILRLSAWGARDLAILKYQFFIEIDWLPGITEDDFKFYKINAGVKQVFANPIGGLPIRFWKSMLSTCNLIENIKWADLNKEDLLLIMNTFKNSRFKVNGKSTFKDEFVTAGGVELKEINFKNFESKINPNMYIIGEAINIDAITGGFNFQAAWTGSILASADIVNKLNKR